MSDRQPRILVTGASGQLGRLVAEGLLDRLPAAAIVAMARRRESVADLAARQIEVREAAYSRPETLDAALAGIDRLLLVSSNEIGQRVAQHRNVIEAAKRAGVGLVAYTSLLKADTSPLGLAEEHRRTEAALRESGIPFALLRNGWYSENYTAAIPAALAHGALIGSAGDARISSASRADYAAAAVAILTAGEDPSGKVYELAGDEAYSLSDFAAELSRQSGKSIAYRNLPEAEYAGALIGAGLPEAVAKFLAAADTGVSKGAVFDDGRQLSRLIGRPTTPVSASIAAALAG